MDVATLIGLPGLGLVLLVIGVLARRHLDALAGDQGDEDLVERRRATLARGALATMAAGAFLVAGGIAAPAVSMWR